MATRTIIGVSIGQRSACQNSFVAQAHYLGKCRVKGEGRVVWLVEESAGLAQALFEVELKRTSYSWPMAFSEASVTSEP